MIRRVDPRLAAYPTVYGFSFSAAPPLGARIRDVATYWRPAWARRFTYRLKQPWRDRQPPKYLSRPYQDVALRGGVQIVRGYFKLPAIRDTGQLQRILSLEYLCRSFGNRLLMEP